MCFGTALGFPASASCEEKQEMGGGEVVGGGGGVSEGIRNVQQR